MQTDHKTLNRIFALVSFLFAFVLYMLTLAPTASFWDPAERIATAYALQIPHPPGAPMYMLLGRLFSMFMPVEHVAYSINMMSAIASGITIMLLYLIVVRLVRTFTAGHPDSWDASAKIAMYGGALIGALTFAATDSLWFISVEAETYAMSLTFTALVFWLALKWASVADEKGNERWLVLIAYLVGIAFGIHLLNLLAIFAIGLIIYFRKFDFTVTGFLAASGLSVLAFLVIFPGTIIWIPNLANSLSQATVGLIGPGLFMFGVMSILGAGIWYTHQKKMKVANYIIVAYTAIMIGYSSYAVIFIRSMSNPAIDQNNPDNIERFTSFIKREQYGSAPLLTGRTFDNMQMDIDRSSEAFFPRRHSSQPSHLAVYANYSSDLDFFLRYQLGHMYFRYFNFNFIGRQADIQDAPSYWGVFKADERFADNPANNFYWYLPFLLGLFGAIYHFVRDWRRALSVLALFVMTGIAIVVFLNQTPMQPRERDYSYAGSFFAFSIWIGLGATGLIDMLRMAVRNNTALIGALVVMYLLVPLRVLTENYFDHDRSQRYVAPDYAYNLLNSVEPHSILFTNGDNDTFPLWFLQEVYGIRTDVRIVCLSLLNTSWYIDQVKNRWNHDAPPVRLSYTDREIQNIEDKFQFARESDFHRPGTVRIPFDRERFARIIADERQPGQVTIDEHIAAGVPVWPEDLHKPEFTFHIPLEELDDEISFFHQGQVLFSDGERTFHYTRIQDDIVLDIIRENLNERPIYFAITVAGDAMLGMENYLRLEGKAFRVIPQFHEEEFGHLDTRIHGERLKQFRLRNVNKEGVYFDQNIRRMLDNYRTVFTRQANAYILQGDSGRANYWLTWGEEIMPFHTVQPDLTSLLTYALRYAQAENGEDATRLADEFLPEFMRELTRVVAGMDSVEDELERIEARLRDPAIRGNADRRNRLIARSQHLENTLRQNHRRYTSNLSRLIVMQQIYFLAGEEDKAVSVADQIDAIVGSPTNFPRDRQSNDEAFSRIFI
ncbi:MAG: DUF2723 domain-containing protein [Candidatus Cyclonatronum sp.]|uniref:glycosyltransferase family 117 protein n=1 Tax=Cyclonatronum sp. TaxID=3024185 RepID=UPI0025B99323|nr:DUF2723 domain-containing protein [Cyclonatronum sp.]MCH8485586.1 DUF2723 domain-containing protein [Cyclonatronum sp.]